MILVVAATERELCGHEGLACGVGPVEAAAATARALATSPPAAVLHVGLAGCRRGCGLEVGGLVIGSEAVYDDVVVALAPRRVSPDPRLLGAAREALPAATVAPAAAHPGEPSSHPVSSRWAPPAAHSARSARASQPRTAPVCSFPELTLAGSLQDAPWP